MDSTAVTRDDVMELLIRRAALLSSRDTARANLYLMQSRHHEAIESGNVRNTAWYGNEVKRICDRLAHVIYDLRTVERDLVYAGGLV